MSPVKISEEDKEKHWQAMLALAQWHLEANEKLCEAAWLTVTAHHDFIRAQEREMMDIPKDEEE